MFCATGANLGVLAFKIRVLRQKLVIICATHAGVIFRVYRLKSVFYVQMISIESAFKISVLRQKLITVMPVQIRQKKGPNWRVVMQ